MGRVPVSSGLRPAWLGLRPGWMAQRGETDGRTDVRKISPFYRTLSLIGATVLLPPKKTKKLI